MTKISAMACDDVIIITAIHNHGGHHVYMCMYIMCKLQIMR